MARQNRRYKPRVRSTRPIGPDVVKELPGKKPFQRPTFDGKNWTLKPPLATRLFEKSAIGRRNSDGTISLTSAEVLYCHWHRSVPLPSLDWLEKEFERNPNLLNEAVILDIGRRGGEMVVPSENLEIDTPFSSWGVRWGNNQNRFKEPCQAYVKMASTNDEFSWNDVFDWCIQSSKNNVLAELYVIDDELHVTGYRVDMIQPEGSNKRWTELSEKSQQFVEECWAKKRVLEKGAYLPYDGDWPWSQIGFDHMSGRVLRGEEFEYVQTCLDDKISSDSDIVLMDDLLSRGLLVRPGFKFGCKWRVYDGDLEESHAPWLIQPVQHASTTWEGVCLSIRLAEGVHKEWVCAIYSDNRWNYLRIKRWLPKRN